MNKIVCEFEHIHGRTCTKWNKREFERARTAEEKKGKEAMEGHKRLRL